MYNDLEFYYYMYTTRKKGGMIIRFFPVQGIFIPPLPHTTPTIIDSFNNLHI